MSAKSNYFRLGIFVIVGVVLGIAGVIVFGGFQLIPEEAVYIETYFDDSVQGLNTGSKVKMRGVEIGTVDAVGFVASTYTLPDDQYREYGRWIRVLIRVEPVNFEAKSVKEMETEIPRRIERGLRLRLASAGLTGGKFIQAEELDPERFPAFDPPWEPEHLFVPAAKGVLEAIVGTVDQIIEKVNKMDFETLFDNADKLVTGLSGAIEDAQVATLSNKAQDLLDDVHAIAGGEDVKQSLANFRQTSEDLKVFIEDFKVSSESGDISVAVENLSTSTESLKETVDRLPGMLSRFDLFMTSEAGEFETALLELRILIQDLRELADVAKRYPASLLLGKEPPESNPEEQP